MARPWTDPVSPTTLWRDAAVNLPENALVGEMYVGDKTGTYFPLVVSASEGTDRTWRYTGLENQVLPADIAEIKEQCA